MNIVKHSMRRGNLLLATRLRNGVEHRSFVQRAMLMSSTMNTNHNPNSFVKSNTIAAVAVMVVSACCLAFATSNACSNSVVAYCDSEFYSVPELGRIMREKLKSGREKLRKQGRPIPSITVRAIDFPDRNGRKAETQFMEMSFDQSSVQSITALVNHWLDVMDDKQTTEKKREIIERFKSFYADKNQLTLPIVSMDKSSSMTITKFIGPSDYDRQNQTSKISMSIYKDSGFSLKHVQSIVKGYEDGFNVNNVKSIKGDEDQGLIFGMDKDVGRAMEAQNKLKAVLEKYFASSTTNGGSDDGEESMMPGARSVNPTRETGGETSSAMEGLRSLGVEVFDKDSNEKYTWDYLAGYDHIKQEIEDTVVNALKHPEIYDNIAKQTRLHYESNRPKAILLEGPPGTGKTLTARILASEVEAPLVVIKLESIVSKWYGDSEKKLSKILDLCDQLENTIIFVDEIDALAQSRDSENGIHEVSKRILSILLQRLEGFHGKSKSLLMCTTNRKQDLDRALISRFDLVIPYDLPDFKTRMEIFKRYAKQFEAQNNLKLSQSSTSAEGQNSDSQNAQQIGINPYERLGKVSEGLSCRDLKEICEYAERKCASRLVKYKIQNEQQSQKETSKAEKSSSSTWWNISSAKKTDSMLPPSLPTLDDYLEGIRLKNLENRSGNRADPFSSV